MTSRAEAPVYFPLFQPKERERSTETYPSSLSGVAALSIGAVFSLAGRSFLFLKQRAARSLHTIKTERSSMTFSREQRHLSGNTLGGLNVSSEDRDTDERPAWQRSLHSEAVSSGSSVRGCSGAHAGAGNRGNHGNLYARRCRDAKVPAGRDPGRLYRVGDGDDCCVEGGPQDRWGLFSYPLFERLKAATPEFEEVTAFQAGRGRLGVRRELLILPPALCGPSMSRARTSQRSGCGRLPVACSLQRMTGRPRACR